VPRDVSALHAPGPAIIASVTICCRKVMSLALSMDMFSAVDACTILIMDALYQRAPGTSTAKDTAIPASACLSGRLTSFGIWLMISRNILISQMEFTKKSAFQAKT
jgi:hypothetical protein